MADVMVDYWSRHTYHPEVKPFVLRVGILSKYEPDSDAIQSVIQEYLLHFDIVISGDGPMDLVNGIVKEIFHTIKHACFVTGIIKQQCSFMCYFNLSLFLQTFVLYLFLCITSEEGWYLLLPSASW